MDCELLLGTAMLHDTGLATATGDADFTLTSSRLAREVAERVGLSTAATQVMQTAITMHPVRASSSRPDQSHTCGLPALPWTLSV